MVTEEKLTEIVNHMTHGPGFIVQGPGHNKV